MAKKKKILEGYKKVGKKFIPPVMQWPGFREISWVNEIIPELIWIAVLQHKIGYRTANEAMADLHKTYIDFCDTKHLHSFFSSYDAMSKNAKESFKEKYKQSEYYNEVFLGLKDLQHYYPNHPLQFLFEGLEISDTEVNIEVIKESIKGILERRTEAGTMVQAAVLFNSMVTGKFNAPKGSIFCEFEEIDNYPDTDKSLQLASSIRAMINAFMNIEFRKTDCEWVNTFWQKSFIIEPPTIKLLR
jgi:hypothetical protein